MLFGFEWCATAIEGQAGHGVTEYFPRALRSSILIGMTSDYRLNSPPKNVSPENWYANIFPIPKEPQGA